MAIALINNERDGFMSFLCRSDWLGAAEILCPVHFNTTVVTDKFRVLVQFVDLFTEFGCL